MKTLNKVVLTISISSFLMACGGGSDSGDNIPINVPGKIIPPGLTQDFIPFEGPSILEKINDFLSGKTEHSDNEKYNVALGHMIAEAFADYPLARTGKVVDLYNLGSNNAKLNLNATCSNISKTGNSFVMTLNEGKENCVRGENIFKKGSKIELIEDTDSSTIHFSNVHYVSNVDGSLKDEYLVNGSLKRVKKSYSNYDLLDYIVDQKLEFQRISPSNTASTPVSLEYIQLSKYKYSEEVSDSSKKLSTTGRIIGQPYKADFSYDFDFETTQTFEIEKLNHLPNVGKLVIYDIFRRYQFGIEQTTPKSLTATVSFQGNNIKPLLWSEIISKK